MDLDEFLTRRVSESRDFFVLRGVRAQRRTVLAFTCRSISIHETRSSEEDSLLSSCLKTSLLQAARELALAPDGIRLD